MTMLGPVGVLHPGAMGAGVAGLLTNRGMQVLWAGQGRSRASRARAEATGLTDVGTVARVAARSEVLLSICPPAAACEVAEQVAATGFDGIYLDANAIAPETARRVVAALPRAQVVDGGIVGPPPTTAGHTRLFLAAVDGDGPAATDALAGCFDGTDLEVVTLEAPAPAASSLKVAYAAWTKGSTALLLTVAAFARASGIQDALLAEWARSQPGLQDRLAAGAPGVAAKAWRFEGELEELAAAFTAQGLPAGGPQAGAEVYRRLAPLRDETGPVTLDMLLTLLHQPLGSVADGAHGSGGGPALGSR